MPQRPPTRALMTAAENEPTALSRSARSILASGAREAEPARREQGAVAQEASGTTNATVPGALVARQLAVVSGLADDAEALFALNLACAHRLRGADVLLIDCVPRGRYVSEDTTRLKLADAVANRHLIDRSWLLPVAVDDAVGGETGIPVIDGSDPALSIANGDLLELLSVMVTLFQVVIVTVGRLRDSRLLAELLPMSPCVYLLTTQDRSAIRSSHMLLMQVDPARRWRDRVELVVESYDPTAVPTAAQIGETVGVANAVPLPGPPAQEAVTSDPTVHLVPWVMRAADAAYSAAIMRIAAASDTVRPAKVEPAAAPRSRPAKGERFSHRRATQVAVALTFAYLMVAVPSLLGGDVLLLLGTHLQAVRPMDMAWTNLAFDSLFIVISGVLTYLVLYQFFHQRAGVFDQLKALTEHSFAGIAFTDEAGNFRYANPVFRRLLDMSQSATDNIRLDALLASRMGGTDPRELLTSVGEGRGTIRLKSGSGNERDLVLSARRIRLPRSNLGWVVNVQDVTAGRSFRETATISTSALEAAADGIMVVDLSKPDMPLLYVNKAFEDITGYGRREVVGKNPRFLQGNERLQPEIAAMGRAIRLRKSITVTLRNYRKDGTLFWNQMRLAPVLDQGGRATHYVAIQHDVTAQREAAQQMDRLAYIDQLTSLPNRTRFRRQLAEMIAAAGGRQVVVVRIDVQRLHDVNISAGHAHGDALLVEVSARLHASVPGGLLGRLTGDEFGLAYYRGADQSPEAPLAAMRDRLLQRYDLRGMSVHVSFAIGYTVCADMDAEAAMRQASIATHEAKAAGLGEVRRFDQAIESVILTRTRLTAEMQQSLGGDDFEMHYQPKVDLRTGAMSGAEALVRWNHPVFGQQRPDRFIPLAEQTGLIVELGALAFTKAARMAASVNGPGRRVLPISVNVSLFQFRQVGLLQNFDQALAEAGAQASWLTLELTESVFAGTSPELIEKLHVLRRRGFGLSIDDFGTGYSSLRYLQNFPLTEIKLDRSFVTNIDQNPYGRAITEAVLTIGNGLSVGVIAEGVETPAECQALRQLGCRWGQGFLFSQPLDADAFRKIAAEGAVVPWRDRFPFELADNPIQ